MFGPGFDFWLRPSLVSSTTTLWITSSDLCWLLHMIHSVCFLDRSHCVMCLCICSVSESFRSSLGLYVDFDSTISGLSLGLDSTYAGLGLDSDSNELVSTITPQSGWSNLMVSGFAAEHEVEHLKNQLDQTGKTSLTKIKPAKDL